MDSQSSKIGILIVGATGTLGSLITKHTLTKPNLITNILVRNPDKNKELTAQVENAGGKVFKGDITKPETLTDITKGIHTVILALSGNITVEEQISFINDCVANKVERIVPSEFSSNPAKYSREELVNCMPILDELKVMDHLRTLPVKTLTINTGIFIDWVFEDVVSKEFGYWGDANTRIQLTTYEDTARVTAAAVARKDFTGDIVFVADDLSVPELAECYNKVRGTDLKPVRYGSLEEMNAKAGEIEKQGDADGAFMVYLGNYYFDERARFDKTNNSEFPEIDATSVEEYLRQRSNVVVGK